MTRKPNTPEPEWTEEDEAEDRRHEFLSYMIERDPDDEEPQTDTRREMLRIATLTLAELTTDDPHRTAIRDFVHAYSAKLGTDKEWKRHGQPPIEPAYSYCWVTCNSVLKEAMCASRSERPCADREQCWYPYYDADGEIAIVRHDALTFEERYYNAMQLKEEGERKLAEAEALEKYAKARFKQPN